MLRTRRQTSQGAQNLGSSRTASSLSSLSASPLPEAEGASNQKHQWAQTQKSALFGLRTRTEAGSQIENLCTVTVLQPRAPENRGSNAHPGQLRSLDIQPLWWP